MPMKSKAQRFLAAVAAGVFLQASQPAECAEWEPAKGPLLTRWAKDVSPRNVHREYPRPQLVREGWQNLNGLWDYAITPNIVATLTPIAFGYSPAKEGLRSDISSILRLDVMAGVGYRM